MVEFKSFFFWPHAATLLHKKYGCSQGCMSSKIIKDSNNI